MKLYVRILMAVLAVAVIGSADAAQRKVLYEHWTNASCPPCAAANPAHRAMISALGPDTVIGVSYHVWWPGADPMYNLNTSEVQTRTNYYSINGVPHSRVGGTVSFTPSSGNAGTVRTAIRNRYAVASPCTIDLSAFVAGETSIGYSGTVHAESDMLDANTRLFVALITDTIEYQSPPGSNGERLFEHVFRDFGTASTGLAFTLAAGEDFTFEGTLNRNAAWIPGDLEVIAFITNYSTRVDYQSEMAEVNQFFGANLETSDAHQTLTTPQTERIYTLALESVGTNEDTYNITLGGELPTGWTRSIEAPGVPADADEISVTIPGLGWSGLTLRVNPNGFPGVANVTVTITSEGWPEMVPLEDDFTTFANPEIIFVDDDGGAENETYYTDALAAAEVNIGREFSWGHWDFSRDALDGDLSAVDLVIWNCGEAQPGSSLSDADMVLLTDYMTNGGNLFIAGQTIGFDLRATAFYQNYLHAFYNGNRPLPAVSGISGDIIGDNLSFLINDNQPGNIDQTRQHAVNPGDGAFACFAYDGSSYNAGVHFANDTYKVLYLGFGVEGINDANDRAAIMTNTLRWMFGITAVDPRDNTIPTVYALAQNFPNPFNPETVIPFSLPEQADVTLTVFDLTGRAVATLVDGPQSAGNHKVSFNGAELSSGVYFYRLESANFVATRKLVLMK